MPLVRIYESNGIKQEYGTRRHFACGPSSLKSDQYIDLRTRQSPIQHFRQYWRHF